MAEVNQLKFHKISLQTRALAKPRRLIFFVLHFFPVLPPPSENSLKKALNGGNRWNILGFNFTKGDALSSVYKISMILTQLSTPHNEDMFLQYAIYQNKGFLNLMKFQFLLTQAKYKSVSDWRLKHSWKFHTLSGMRLQAHLQEFSIWRFGFIIPKPTARSAVRCY
jgi:hypothetical protein